MDRIKTKIFTGSAGWLIFWIIIFWPIAIWYYFNRRELVELKRA